MRGLWLLGVFGIAVVAFVGWNVTDAAVWPQYTLPEQLDVCATDVQACAGFLRGSIGKHHRQNTRAALFWDARPVALCVGLVARMTDAELVRAFADWGERNRRRFGGTVPAHLVIPQFLREKLGCRQGHLVPGKSYAS